MNKLEMEEAWRVKDLEDKKSARKEKNKAETDRLEKFFDVKKSSSTGEN